MTVTLTRAKPVEATGERTALVVPEAPLDANKAWRKLVTGVTPDIRSSFGIDGQWLSPGHAYDLPVGALVLSCDQYANHRVIRLLRADIAELVEVKTWTQKAPLGARALNYISKRLPAGASHMHAAGLDVPNRYDGRCVLCHGSVPAGTGLYRDGKGVTHLGECPPRPPRPPRRNAFAGCCDMCGGWVEARAGLLATDLLGSYTVHHDGDCPSFPEPRPAIISNFGGWCSECTQWVEPGQGVWNIDHLRHGVMCPPPARAEPTWRMRHRGNHSEVGDTIRVLLHHYDDDPPLPMEAPGARVVDERYVEVIVTVVEAHPRAWGGQYLRVRAATGDEAAPIMLADLDVAMRMRPAPSLLRGPFSAERIGPLPKERKQIVRFAFERLRGGFSKGRGGRPWVAELLDVHPWMRYDRRFLPHHADYTHASRSGRRGIIDHWVLKPNRVYEAQVPDSWSRSHRMFLWVTGDGDVVEVDREHAEAWLRHGVYWLTTPGLDGTAGGGEMDA